LPPSTRREVLESVAQAAELGYAVDPGGFFEGTSAVAVAIRDANGRPVAALSVIMPPERLRSIELETMGAQLLAAAAELETQTGYRTESPG
jgi:DNA-binding IclR family transcriptional regulator